MKSSPLSQLIKKNENSISETIICKIKKMLDVSNSKRIILFGAGIGGATTRHFLETYNLDSAIKCFVDNNPLKYDKDFNGLKIFSCDKAFSNYQDEVVLISCGEGDEIIKQLQQYNIPLNRIYIPDVNSINETDPIFIQNNLHLFNQLYESLGDKKSKNVLLGILNYKMTHDIQYISKISDASQDQYFDHELIKYNTDDVFLDCGAYTGDTAEAYVQHNNGKYKKIICLEADTENCAIIHNKAEQLKLEVIDVACWSESTMLKFDKLGSGSGTISTDSQPQKEFIQIKADTIDHIVGKEKISFIKMDIEGAEYDALWGGQTYNRKR